MLDLSIQQDQEMIVLVDFKIWMTNLNEKLIKMLDQTIKNF